MAALNRRDALKLLASVGAASAAYPLLSACTPSGGSSAASGGPVRVALIVPQSSSDLHTMGDQMTAGFNLFLQNSNNMLGNRPAQVTIYDEGNTASSGLAAVNKILKGGLADVMVGVGNSQVLSAIRDGVEKAKVPLIASGNTPASLGSDPKYIWRASSVGGDAGAVMGTYFNQAPGIRKIAIYDDGTPDGTAEAQACKTAFTGSATMVSGGLASATSQINSSGADAVFASATGQNAITFLHEVAGSVNKPVYGPGFLTEGDVLGKEGNAARNVYTASNYSYDLDNDANRAFASQYYSADNGQVPTTYAMATYDALNVLDRAIRQITDDITPAKINAKVGTAGQFDSPRGTWQFTQDRTPQQTWYLRQVRQDGRVWQNNVLQRLIAPEQTA